VLLAIAATAVTLRRPAPPGEFDITGFSELPVLVNGRVKPLDTVARTSLLMMQGRQRVAAPEGRSITPNEWLLDAFFKPEVATRYATFEIVHPDVLALLNLTTDVGAGGKRFALSQLLPRLGDLDRQARLADDTEHALRTPFQRGVVQLRNSIVLYQRLQNSLGALADGNFTEQLGQLEQILPEGVNLAAAAHSGQRRDDPNGKFILEMAQSFAVMETYAYFRPIPPETGAPDGTDWQTAGAAWNASLVIGKADPVASLYAAVGRAWRRADPAAFNAAVEALRARFEPLMPQVMTKSRVEMRFNAAQPFSTSMVLYVFAFLFAVISWLRWPDSLGRAAFGFICIAFALTTAGIATRMWLEGRPPVTNLYSSALFVGWGAVALCVWLEYFYKNAMGSVAASLIGFATLVIAHHLSLGGDTLEMMRAVLDSNFWLATHVITIGVGYSATFLAGALGLLYVLRGVFTRSLDGGTARALSRMMYGSICFATLFSFLGTVLGGIWADQSWGRFWGWDPKENGALIIVMWCAIILHARWGGLIRERGLAVMSIFGNVVTAWSWFGVNLLGVGLHSYGFMESGFWWLIGFVTSQLAVMAIAALPQEKWRSFIAMTRVTGGQRPAPALELAEAGR
jgi:ABC-type transport system involved in cytochrome c biogenesis permease subunit